MKIAPHPLFPDRDVHVACLGLLFLAACLMGMGMGWAAGKLPGLVTGGAAPGLVAFAYFVWRDLQKEDK